MLKNKDDFDSSELMTDSGIRSTSNLITDDGKTVTETSTYYEEKWEYGDDINAKAWRILTFSFTTVSDQYIRKVKKTVIKKYKSNSKEPYSTEESYEYGEWMKTGGRKKSNAWTDPSEDAWFIIASGVTISASISLDSKPKDNKVSTKYSDTNSEVESAFVDPVADVADQGFDFTTIARVNTDDTAQWVSGAGIGQRDKLLGGIESPVDVGDIIIRPGILKSDVQKAGFGVGSNVDFFTISADQLRSAKTKNSPGDIPDNWDFLVITNVSDTRHSGSKEFSYSTLHTWVDSYMIKD